MARRPYTLRDYILDREYCQSIDDSRLPIRGYIPDELIPEARKILNERYRRLNGIATQTASVDQIRAAAPSVYDAAKKRMALYEQQHRSGDSDKQSLEKRAEQTALDNQKEMLFGDEAEELGYCGCVPVSRQRQQ